MGGTHFIIILIIINITIAIIILIIINITIAIIIAIIGIIINNITVQTIITIGKRLEYCVPKLEMPFLRPIIHITVIITTFPKEDLQPISILNITPPIIASIHYSLDKANQTKLTKKEFNASSRWELQQCW